MSGATLQDRLRAGYSLDRDEQMRIRIEAAAKIDALRKALEPFAAEADRYEPDEGDGDHPAWDTTVTIGNLRAARSLLSEGGGGSEPR